MAYGQNKFLYAKAIRRIIRLRPNLTISISLVALFISGATAYFTLLPSYSSEIVRISELDVEKNLIHFSHIVHNSGNSSFSIFGSITYQLRTEDWNPSDEICAARMIEPVEGARYLEAHEEGGDLLGVSPTILAPRETEIVKSTYKYDPDWGDGTEIPSLPSIVCTTLLLWAPSYGNFYAPSTPIFLFKFDSEITNVIKGRSFESARVSTIDIVFRKLYSNEYEHFYFQ